jgi:hypothetical protein
MTGPVPVLIRSDQSSDTLFTRETTSHGKVVYLFNRSSDSYINNVDGQVYFIFRDGNDKFCFVLCDGVGQSYCGQLAAKFLGEYLFNWLENLDANLLQDPTLVNQLTSNINILCDEAQQMVIKHQLPENMPDLLLMALTEQKSYGSEAVFVAGRIDFQLGKMPPILNLFWLGDTKIHLFDKNGGEVDIPGSWINSERWSTKFGVKGTEIVNHWCTELWKIKKIVIHSDGLKASALNQLYSLLKAPGEMNSAIESLRSLPESDDVSLISFEFLHFKKRNLYAIFIEIISRFLHFIHRIKYGIFRY